MDGCYVVALACGGIASGCYFFSKTNVSATHKNNLFSAGFLAGVLCIMCASLGYLRDLDREEAKRDQEMCSKEFERLKLNPSDFVCSFNSDQNKLTIKSIAPQIELIGVDK